MSGVLRSYLSPAISSVALARHSVKVRVTWLAEGLALALVLAFALRLRLWNLDAYSGSFDEGIRSEQLLLMSAGYRPFRDIFSSQGPLLLDLLYPFYLWFGQTLEAARAGVVVFSTVGLVAAWWLGRMAAGPIAGLAAAGLLAMSPGYLEGSRLALAEVPTIAPALLALGAAYAYRQSSRTGWLVVSAVLCALALLIKPMVVHVGLPLMATLAQADRRQSARDFARYGSIVVLLCAGVILALGPAAVWDNLGAYRAAAGHRLGADWVKNLRLAWIIVDRERAGLLALAVIGLVFGCARHPGRVVPIALWVAAVLSLFALYGDLADKHIVYLIPPLALLGGVGLGLAFQAATVLGGGRRTGWDLAVASLGLAVLGVYLWNLQPLYRTDLYVILDAERVAERRRDQAAELDMADVMLARAGPSDWVLSDNPNAAFRARRMVIPALADTSGTRVDAGSLTSARVIDLVAQYRPAVVVTWSRRLGRLDAFNRWLPEGGYQLDRTYENGWRLYVRDQGSGLRDQGSGNRT